MTRQNCKNCGEPYTFDNLVTPGRATMICGACQRKIYIHTGQIYFEPPSSTHITNTSVKISLGQGVSIVQDTTTKKEGTAEKEAQPLPLKKWQSAKYEESISSLSELEEVEVSLSMNQQFVLGILYLFSLIWVVLSIIKMVDLMNTTSWDGVEGVVTTAFYAVLSISIAEGLKSFWKGQ